MRKFPLPKRIFFRTFIAAVFISAASCSTTHTTLSYYDNPQIETNSEDVITDSVSSGNSNKIRLQDPQFDVRYERGVLKPWHDVKSFYLRRTIPVKHLASCCENENS